MAEEEGMSYDSLSGNSTQRFGKEVFLSRVHSMTADTRAD